MASDLQGAAVQVERQDDGALWLVRLARPKANIVDEVMTAALTGVFVEARTADRPEGHRAVRAGAALLVRRQRAGARARSGRRACCSASMACSAPSRPPRSRCWLRCAASVSAAGSRSRRSATACSPHRTRSSGSPRSRSACSRRWRRSAAARTHRSGPLLEDLCLTGRTIAADEAQRIGLLPTWSPRIRKPPCSPMRATIWVAIPPRAAPRGARGPRTVRAVLPAAARPTGASLSGRSDGDPRRP